MNSVLYRFTVSILFLNIFLSSLSSQVLKGRITDSRQNPVPFALIYDESSLTGTTANADGYYEIPLDAGQHSVIFKAMGYYLVKKSVLVADKTVSLNIVLQDQPVEVKEIVIRPGKEDPAYRIMRKSIGRASFHLNQVKQYTAEVYLRGTAHLIKIPKFIAKRASIDNSDIKLKNGDVFMEESVNVIKFTAPDKYEQQVRSIQTTYPGSSNDVNPMGLINSSLYEPKIEDFISPLSPVAMRYYKFRYEGFFDEGAHAVFKIQVIPKQDSPQLMRGYLYIVDQLWCLHSADVSVKAFYGMLTYKTIYSAVKPDVWMPVSHQFFADFGIMGIKATYNYNSSVRYKELVLNPNNSKISDLPGQYDIEKEEVPKTVPVVKSKQQKDLEKLMESDDLTNREMMKLAALMSKKVSEDTVRSKSLEIRDENKKTVHVDSNAVRNDTAFWNSVRPIPLTTLESKITVRPDSSMKITGDSVTISIGTKTNKNHKWSGKAMNFIMEGHDFNLSKSTSIRYEGLIGLKKFDFNTVDGFIFRQSFRIQTNIDSAHNLSFRPLLAYGFSRNRFLWKADISYDYAPFRGGHLKIHVGSESADFNNETGINPTINSLASLFFRRNYLKLYHQNMAYIDNSIELATGLNFSTIFGYMTAMPLENHSDYSFFFRSERDYTANFPDVQSADRIQRNGYHEEAFWDIKLEFTPRHYYKIAGGRKQYMNSKYPTFSLRNKTAIPGVINSSTQYSFVETGLRQNIEWNLMHSFKYNIKAGFFVNDNLINLTGYKYFNNQDIPVVLGENNHAFRLLPFYRYSTDSNFLEAHFTYTTPYLLVKYLPFLNNKMWRENLHINYLNTAAQNNYWEAGYSISEIYMAGSIGFFMGFNGFSSQSFGLQVSFNL